jgi:hypothetical protein
MLFFNLTDGPKYRTLFWEIFSKIWLQDPLEPKCSEFILNSVEDPDDICPGPDPDPSLYTIFYKLLTFSNKNFLAQQYLLNLIYGKKIFKNSLLPFNFFTLSHTQKINIHVFLSIPNTF